MDWMTRQACLGAARSAGRAARRLVGGWEDAVQIAYLEALELTRRLGRPPSPAAALAAGRDRIRNLALAERRERARRARAARPAAVPPPAPAAAEWAEAALKPLRAGERELLERAYGIGGREPPDGLGPADRKRLSRVMRRLRAAAV